VLAFNHQRPIGGVVQKGFQHGNSGQGFLKVHISFLEINSVAVDCKRKVITSQ
jgi:hypothetical protein